MTQNKSIATEKKRKKELPNFYISRDSDEAKFLIVNDFESIRTGSDGKGWYSLHKNSNELQKMVKNFKEFKIYWKVAGKLQAGVYRDITLHY